MILIVKHSPNLDMVRILIVYYECFLIISLVNVPSSDNAEEHPSSDSDDKTPSSSGHG